MAQGPRTVVHLAPHPDDEALGAPALLLALRAAGHRVINVACSLGRPGQHERRRKEAEAACRRAGFELIVLDRAGSLPRADDHTAQRELTERVREMVLRVDPAVVVAPSPHDRHPGHEVVGRAARDALAADGMPRLWLWGLWGELPLPTLFFSFGEPELEAALDVLRAHAGELERNDYAALLRSRAAAAHVLGSERVFGFGGPRRPGRYAELLTEVGFADGQWWAGASRHADVAARAWFPIPRSRPLGWWMHAPSFTTRLAEAEAEAHAARGA